MKTRLCKGIKIRPEEFGGVVQIKDRGAFQVDHIGFEILSQIRDGIEIEQIISHMREKYEDSPRVEEDIHKFTWKLAEQGVIEIEK